MKFTILSGSPKGEGSITLHYLHYIQKHFPQHQFETFHIGKSIKSLEKKQDAFDAVIETVRSSDGVFWITPVFYFLIPCQLKRFIELIHERGATGAFQGKYATAVSTSIRFFDTTAHNYLHAISDDLRMNYVGFNSLDMWDIFTDSKREQFLLFAEHFFSMVERKAPVPIQYPPLPAWKTDTYLPGEAAGKTDNSKQKILILTDQYQKETNLGKMITHFSGSVTQKPDIIEISKLGLKGGCLSCIRCGYDNTCIYKDGFTQFWREKMQQADVILFAGEIRDRFLSAQFKMVLDRSFFMNHTPSLIDKQIGFLISGPLSQVDNLRNMLTAYVECQRSNLLGFVTDEHPDPEKIDHLIESMAANAVSLSNKGYIMPHTFYREGGMKIFRDDVYGRLRFICQADHRWYRDNGIYDSFPQKDRLTRKRNMKLMFLTRFKPIRKKLYNTINKEMLKPIRKAALSPDK